MKQAPPPPVTGSSDAEGAKLNLTRDSVMLSVGRTSAAFARLLVKVAVARIFASELGFTAEWEKTWLLFNTFFFVFIFAIPSTIYYFYPRYSSERRSVFLSQSMSLLFVLGLLYALFLLLVVPHAAVFYNCPPMVGHYRWFAIYAFAMVAGAFVEPVFIVLKRVRLLALFTLSEAALFALCAVLPILLGNLPQLPDWLPQVTGGSASIRLAFLLLTLLAVVRLVCAHFLLRIVRADAAWRLRWLGFSELKRQLLYTLPITATTIVGFLAVYLDKNVVATYFKEAADFARYQAGAMEVPVVSVIVGSVSAVMLPKLSELQHKGRNSEICGILAGAIEKVAWLTWPLFTMLFVLAESLYIFLWGPEYALSAAPFRIYLLLFPLRLLFHGQILNTLGKGKWVLVISSLDLLLNLGLSLTLVRTVGLLGPALATMLATFAELAVYNFVLARSLSSRVRAMYPIKRLARISFVALAAGLACWGASQLGSTAVQKLLLGAAAHLILWLGWLKLSGDWRRLKEDPVS